MQLRDLRARPVATLKLPWPLALVLRPAATFCASLPLALALVPVAVLPLLVPLALAAVPHATELGPAIAPWPVPVCVAADELRRRLGRRQQGRGGEHRHEG